jgi:acetyl-CoA synthetase
MMLDWYVEPTTICNGGFVKGDITWFEGGKMNVCYNALDRYVMKTPKNIAIRFEGDEPGDVQSFTFEETLSKVSQIANALKLKGVRKGDVVTIYMPMILDLPLTMLACARIDAVH